MIVAVIVLSLRNRPSRPSHEEEEEEPLEELREISYPSKPKRPPPPLPPQGGRLSLAKKQEAKRKRVTEEALLREALEKRVDRSHRFREASVSNGLSSFSHRAEHLVRPPSRAQKAIDRLSSLPQIVVYYEILNRPKGWQSDRW